MADARAVHDYIHLWDSGKYLHHLLLFGYIRRVCRRFPASRLYFLHRFRCLPFVKIHYIYARPLLSQEQGYRLADAAASARDDGILSLQTEHAILYY